MRQVALGRRAGHVELRHRGANAFVFAARHADGGLELVGTDAQRRHRIVRTGDRGAMRLERADVVAQPLFVHEHGGAEVLDPAFGVVEFRRERLAARLEFAARLFEAAHFTRQPRRPLDQRGVRGSSFRSAAAQFLHRLARHGQRALRLAQTLVRHPLLLFEREDGGAGFFLPQFERLAFLFGLVPLTRELIALQRHLRRVFRRALQLRLECDDLLLLAMMFGVERGNGLRRFADHPFQFLRLGGKAGERIALAFDARPQVLDLTFRLEDAARLLAVTASHQVGSAEHLAVGGDDGARRERRGRLGTLVGVGQPRLTDGAAHDVAVRTVQPHD